MVGRIWQLGVRVRIPVRSGEWLGVCVVFGGGLDILLTMDSEGSALVLWSIVCGLLILTHGDLGCIWGCK